MGEQVKNGIVATFSSKTRLIGKDLPKFTVSVLCSAKNRRKMLL